MVALIQLKMAVMACRPASTVSITHSASFTRVSPIQTKSWMVFGRIDHEVLDGVNSF